jgi:hypothetical protein
MIVRLQLPIRFYRAHIQLPLLPTNQPLAPCAAKASARHWPTSAHRRFAGPRTTPNLAIPTRLRQPNASKDTAEESVGSSDFAFCADRRRWVMTRPPEQTPTKAPGCLGIPRANGSATPDDFRAAAPPVIANADCSRFSHTAPRRWSRGYDTTLRLCRAGQGSWASSARIIARSVEIELRGGIGWKLRWQRVLVARGQRR